LAVTRRDSRTRPAQAAAVPPPAPSVAAENPPPSRAAARIGWGLALAWIAVLATLAITAANPVIVNRKQLLAADFVVTARIIDWDAGECKVEKQWTPGPPVDAITVANLKETRAVQGETFVLALEYRAGGSFAVIPAPPSGGPLLIYPATPDVVTQVANILDE
jgi:hypothetical protein